MVAEALRPVTTTEIEAFARDGAVLVRLDPGGTTAATWDDRLSSWKPLDN